MLQVFHSNQVERLVAQLIAQLDAQRQLEQLGAFATIDVLVSEPRLEDLLKMEIARASGICANVAFWTMETFWADRLARIGRRLIDEPLMRALIMEALEDVPWLEREPDMAPVRRYLGLHASASLPLELTPAPAQAQAQASPRGDASPGQPLDDQDLDDQDLDEHDEQAQAQARAHAQEAALSLTMTQRRALQLASQLGHLFLEYTRSRAGVLEGWLGQELYYQDTTAAPIELWQRALWRRLFAPELGLRDSAGPATRALCLWHELPALLEQRQQLPMPLITHIFGLAALGPTAYDILAACARRHVLFAYSLNPSAHYWEDLRFGRGQLQAVAPASAALSSASVEHGQVEYQGDDSFWDEDVPHLLKLWGFGGALHLRVLTQLPDVQVDALELYEDPAPDPDDATLLQRVQSELLHMQRLRQALPARDQSLRVLACPSVKREVEVVASEIWSVLARNRADHARDPERHPLMRFDDIAVLLPAHQRDLYQTHIRAVFPSTHELPFHMVDVTALSTSRALEAVQLMLTLPFGQFKRQELLRLLTHPNLIGRFPTLDPQDWLRWCDELKILHGADRHDHADTYIEGELFHWDQGLKRLVLGAMMTGKKARDRRIFHQGKRHYLPCEQHGMSDQQSAARLVLMARSLIEDARFCREAKMPLTQWARFLCRMTSTYLTAVEPEDEFNLQRCRLKLMELEAQDLTGRPIDYALASELALKALESLELRQGQFLLDGVAVAGLVPQRIIPWRVIFVLGLGEGCYPSAEQRRPEDLRFVTDREGQPITPYATVPDITTRDLERYTMLELVLNARDALILSHVNRDMRTGERRQPSVVISELLYALGEDFEPVLAQDDALAPGVEPLDPQDPLASARHQQLITRHELRRFHERYFPEVFGQASGPPSGHASGHPLGPGPRSGAWASTDAQAQPGAPLDAAALSAALTPSRQPEATREAHTLALRYDLERHARAHGARVPPLELLREAMPAPRWRALSDALSLMTPAQLAQDAVLPTSQGEAEHGAEHGADRGQASSSAALVRLSIHDLRAFLECPLQGSARFLLRLGEDEQEDILLEESELFETSTRARSILLHDVFWEKLAREQRERARQDFGDLYDARARYWELMGQVPTGPFYRAARQKHLRTLQTWADNLPRLGLDALPRVEVRRLGRQIEHELIDVAQGPLGLDVETPTQGRLKVELYGRTEPLLPERHATLITSPTHKVWSLSRKHFMRGFLDHVVLTAQRDEPTPWAVYINPAEEVQGFKMKHCVRRFKPLEPEVARRYLRDLIADMLGQVHAYYLPLEVVFEHHERDAPLELVAERARRNRWQTTSADFGPVRDARRFELPERAQDLIARRFGLFFDRLAQ